CEIVIADLPEADITDAAGFDAFLAANKPDAVIHCAAMTAVDKCETEIEFAYKLNAFGTANVAAACNRHGVRLIAISTDYVFEGDSDRPYNEFDRATGGNTVYGKSKFAGEEAVRRHCPNHVICRISWLYGHGGPSFVHAMMSLADGTRPMLKVVADQHGNPTSTTAVARQLRNILAKPGLVGTFHLTCEGEATWFEFAQEIFRLAGKTQAVSPCTTDEFPRPAPRPKNSRLDKMMLRLAGLPPMPDWRDALAEFMKNEFPVSTSN
ncbi:MAG: dTDP-4-dehydrorhamnose reductase, partial [Lentisphaeria bacterium]|nr:dTDP-4-dehydrorhamnose reductase [Lentisphaeria bacterium]